MTENVFAMINKNSPNFKPCQEKKKSTSEKKVLAHLKLPFQMLDANLISTKESDFCEEEAYLKEQQSSFHEPLKKYAMTLITKFKWLKNKNNCDELMVSKENKPYVEILAFKKHSSDKYWMIPSGHSKVNHLSFFKNQLTESQCPKRKDLSNEKYKMINDLYKKIFVNSKIIYRGHLNDGRKGKNSLIEVIAENCHHFNDNIISLIEKSFNFDFSSANYCLKWVDLYDPSFYPPHRFVLKKCAKFLNAQWID